MYRSDNVAAAIKASSCKRKEQGEQRMGEADTCFQANRKYAIFLYWNVP